MVVPTVNEMIRGLVRGVVSKVKIKKKLVKPKTEKPPDVLIQK